MLWNSYHPSRQESCRRGTAPAWRRDVELLCSDVSSAAGYGGPSRLVTVCRQEQAQYRQIRYAQFGKYEKAIPIS